MSRTRFARPARITPVTLVVAAVVALAMVVTVSSLLPEGEHDDGTITPVTGQHVATTGVPEPGSITPEAQREIDRVLDASPTGVSGRTTVGAQAAQLVRCAEFEGQRYCLGRGWTTAEESEVQARVARTTTARTVPLETTGDLADEDFLAQRAAMDPAEREAAEREELEAAARGVAKVVLLRHQLLGESLPAGFLDRHPEARATTDTDLAAARQQVAARPKTHRDYPRKSTVLRTSRTAEQVRSYWCGPATMQMITWGWSGRQRSQQHWANRLGTTTSGSAISDMVRVINQDTGWDAADRAGQYVVLDISSWSFRKWLLLTMRHVEDYRAPMVYHPILLKQFYPYLDDDASGHFQVGRGYNKRGRKPASVGYFEPWNQQRFDPSEPFISRVQWRSAYRSYRANQAHPHQNIGV